MSEDDVAMTTGFHPSLECLTDHDILDPNLLIDQCSCAIVGKTNKQGIIYSYLFIHLFTQVFMYCSVFNFREEKSFYTLRAQAVDIETGLPLEPESEFIIKVQDINDNAPRFSDGPYSGSVPEMSPVGMRKIAV